MKPADDALQLHRALAQALSRPQAWPEPLPPGTRFERIETHISTLLLAGDSAIKLKKPLALGFLDFSTPAVRHHIREGSTHQLQSAIQMGSQFGMQTMDGALADLVRQGRITREVALQRSSSPDTFGRLFDSPEAVGGMGQGLLKRAG